MSNDYKCMHPEGYYCPFNDEYDTLDGYRYESNKSHNNLHTQTKQKRGVKNVGKGVKGGWNRRE